MFPKEKQKGVDPDGGGGEKEAEEVRGGENYNQNILFEKYLFSVLGGRKLIMRTGQ